MPSIAVISLAAVGVVVAFLVIKKLTGGKRGPDTFESHVHRHGSLTNLVPFLWEVTGHTPRMPPRNMHVFQTPMGGLVLFSVVALNETEMKRLESLGTPEVMVVPNGFHRSDAAVYKQRYPKLRVLCPASALKKVQDVVRVDATVEDSAEFLAGLGVEAVQPQGIDEKEFAFKLKIGKSRNETALLVTDLLFNINPAKANIIARLLGCVGPLRVSRLGKLFMFASQPKLATWLRWVSSTPVDAIVMAHGEPYVGRSECASALAHAVSGLRQH